MREVESGEREINVGHDLSLVVDGVRGEEATTTFTDPPQNGAYPASCHHGRSGSAGP